MGLKETYFSLGSNQGDRKGMLDNAVSMMAGRLGSEPVAVSSYIETEPWGFDSDEKFLNCAARFDVSFSPRHILEICKGIESDLGRVCSAPLFNNQGRRIYRSRPIDIDILFYGDTRLQSDVLVIPHPMIGQRDFVLRPLREIASEYLIAVFPEYFK